MVWETLTGEHTGTYIVGRLGQHWADFDKPSVPEQADLEEYQKVVGSSVESLISRYYEFMPKVSNMGSSSAPSKFSEIITFNVRYGKGSDFRSAISRIYEAGAKDQVAGQLRMVRSGKRRERGNLCAGVTPQQLG